MATCSRKKREGVVRHREQEERLLREREGHSWRTPLGGVSLGPVSRLQSARKTHALSSLSVHSQLDLAKGALSQGLAHLIAPNLLGAGLCLQGRAEREEKEAHSGGHREEAGEGRGVSWKDCRKGDGCPLPPPASSASAPPFALLSLPSPLLRSLWLLAQNGLLPVPCGALH
jgi:hypothetical protein